MPGALDLDGRLALLDWPVATHGGVVGLFQADPHDIDVALRTSKRSLSDALCSAHRADLDADELDVLSEQICTLLGETAVLSLGLAWARDHEERCAPTAQAC